MTAIDDYLIDKAERFCHLTQRYFGAASPSWERLFLVLALLQFVSKEVPNDWGKWISFIDGLIVGQLITRFIASLKRTPPVSTELARNRAKLTMTYARPLMFIMGVLFLPADVWFFWNPHTAWFQCSALAYYFAACDDLPAGTSNVREFVNAITAALSRAAPATE